MIESQEMGDDETKVVMLAALTAFGPSGVKKVLEGMEEARKVIVSLKSNSTLIDDLSDEELFADRKNENPNAGEAGAQEDLSAEDEVVAWRNWSHLHGAYYLDDVPRGILKVHDEKNEPLVRQSSLTACQQEVERLRDLLDRIIPYTFEYDEESDGYFDTDLTIEIRAALGGVENG